jgi:hypothetical protein
MKSLFLILGVLGLAFLGMAVRLLFIKGSEVRGGCASKNPLLAEDGVRCGMCGAPAGEACQKEEQVA